MDRNLVAYYSLDPRHLAQYLARDKHLISVEWRNEKRHKKES